MNYSLTEEEWECVRVCVSNAPIPYDITKKKIPALILKKIGQPTKVKHEGIAKVKYILVKIGEPTPRRGEPLTIPYYDLTPYGIEPLS